MRRLGIVGLCVTLIVTATGMVRAAEEERPKVQLAILLDTSGSMSGLIDQARTQLWRIVNEFATAKKDGQPPVLQVALYEYGKSSIPASEGYLRMIAPLTDDLDKVSEELFKLTTNGGSEYCGMVIQASVEGLKWSPSDKELKAIFIAGNEPFTQGSVDYRTACKAAITKGIIVNTIHCGSEQQGIDGKWKDGAMLADGSYMNIDQNRAIAHIAAPQDKEIARLGAELNKTYVPYGGAGTVGAARQMEQDANARKRASAGSYVQRMVAKSSAQYRNVSWDLVDAVKEGKVDLKELKKDELPENMQKMTPEERKAYLEQNAKKRAEIQEKIRKLNEERRDYVAAERKKQAKPGEKTLDQAVIGSVREQAESKGYKF